QIALPPADADWMDSPPGESSAAVRPRVARCRQIQLSRQGCTNAALDVSGLDHHCRLDGAARKLLRTAMQRWDWSGRVVHRVLRVSRALADMQGAGAIGAEHIAEAIQYRQPWGA